MGENLLVLVCGEKGAERRISVTTATILVLTVLVTGAAIFFVLARQFDAELENGMVRTLNDKAALFHSVINAAADDVENIANHRLRLRKLMLAVNAGEASESDLQEIGAVLDNIMQDSHASALELYDMNGKLISAKGELLRGPSAVELRHPGNSTLLWKGGYHLRTAAQMRVNGRPVGKVRMEIPLPALSKGFQDYRGLGDSGEIVLCGPLPQERMRCFPSRLRPKGGDVQRSPDGVPLPISKALDGESGTGIILDYRRQEVFAAYQPVGDSGLGMAVKMDVRELEQPIRKHLLWIAPFFGALVALGFALLRWQVGPLVREVVSSRARVHAILDSAADGLITVDERGIIESFNISAARIFGYTRFEVVGRNVGMLMPEPYRSRHDEGIQNYLRSGVAKVIGLGARELEGQRKDGSVFPMELTLGEMVLDGRRLFIGSVRDTSAYKQAHEQLKSSFAALQAANRGLEEAHAQLRQAEQDKERQMNALAEANVHMALYHAAIEGLREADATFSGNGDDDGFCRNVLTEAMILTGARYGAACVFDAEGRVEKFLTEGVSEEVRQRIGAPPTGKGLLHAFFCEGRIERINDIAADPRACGFPPGHPPMRSLLGVPLQVSGATRAVIYLADKHSGEPFTVHDQMMVEMLAQGVENVLERNELLASLRESNQALTREREEQRRLIARLEDAQNQLLQSEKMASIGQLAAGVAHEINNPIGYVYSNLGSLNKYIQAILDVVATYEKAEGAIADGEVLSQVQAAKQEAELKFLREDIFALMGESQEGIARVKKIVQDLKDFSHVDEAEWQWADLHKGLDSTLNIVWNEIKYKAEVVKEYGELPEVECLPSQLNQVFMNMLVNAAHAIEERGTITLRSGVAGEEVWVEIADTGKGIPPENLNRVFDPFFTTKPVGKGTGLGLSLSYSIVQKHHGRIEVSSEVGKGTAFRIFLPVRQPEAKA